MAVSKVTEMNCFDGRPFSQLGARPFVFIFMILSFLVALFLLVPAEPKKESYLIPKSCVPSQ